MSKHVFPLAYSIKIYIPFFKTEFNLDVKICCNKGQHCSYTKFSMVIKLELSVL
jgi:hypothetical protein